MWSWRNFSVKRIVVYVIVFLFGLGTGILGYRFLLRSHLWMGAVGESFMAEQYAYMKYREASYAEAVSTMEAYISYLDRLKPPIGSNWSPGQSPWLDERGIRSEKILSWGRLALLHERNNNTPASDSAWTQAEALAAQSKWKDPSRRNIRGRIERLDHYWDRGKGKNKE